MRELKENTQLSPFTHLNIVVNRNESRQTATTRIRVIYPFKFSIDKGANSSEDMLAVARSHADEIADVIGNVEAKLQMAFIIVNKQTQAVFDVNFSKQYFAQADKAQLLNTTIFAYVSEYELICEIVDADVTIQPLPPYPPIPVKPTQHNTLMGLDYAHAGHTGFQPTLTSDNAGEGIDIADGVISCTVNGAEWGNITGDIDDQTDLTNALNSKQDTLTAGTNINIDSNNVISAVDTKYTQGTGITIDHNNVVSNDVSPLVPAQATPTNQLADKDFVNSSIATSTATFRGTYNVVTDLHLSTSATHQQVATALGNTISLADNNDYCFVAIPTDDLTPTETLQVDRYKYNGSSWSFEYTLNNSGYTSAQWKAINSGITSGKVTQYDDYATSKQDTLIAGTNITIGADGKTISSDIPQATQSVAGKVLLGAAGGAATYESVENRLPICYPTTASNVDATSMLIKSSVSDNGRMLTENGFVYNTSGNPTVSDNKVICDLGVGKIEKLLSGLTVNTTYYIKSYGINQGGTSYGDLLTQATNNSPIPQEYQLVEYLQGTGVQYFEILNYIDLSNVQINAKIEITALSNPIPFGSRLGSTVNMFFVNFSNNNDGHWQLNYGSARYIDNNVTTVLNNIYNIELKKASTTIFRYKISDANSTYVHDFSLDINRINNFHFLLFAFYNINTPACAKCKIYNFEIKDLDIDIKLYPVYRKADNKPGMYDIVNNVFYTNQGTGEFTVGPDKQWE